MPDPPTTLDYATAKPRRRVRVPLVVAGAVIMIIPSTWLFLGVTYLFVVPLVLGLVIVILGFVGRPATGGNWLTHNATSLSIGLGLTAIVGPCSLIAHHNRSGPPVHFILPDGYRGAFRIVVDPVGLDVKPTNGTYVFRIPVGGILRVKSARPFRRWHEETAAYNDGTTIPDGFLSVDPSTIALHGLFSRQEDGEDSQWWMVGTKDDADAAWRDTFDLKVGNRADE